MKLPGLFVLLGVAGLALASSACLGDPPETDSCDPNNNEYETALCECVEHSDCTCQNFTGAEFLEEALQSACDEDLGTCIPCFYM